MSDGRQFAASTEQTPASSPHSRPASSPRFRTPGAAAPTLFHQDWWLDAATGGAWDRVEVARDGQVIGVPPFVRSRRHGLTRLSMPHYARVLGPMLHLPPSKPVSRVANMCTVIADLIARLPRFDVFSQSLPPGSEAAFGFALSGWNVGQSYTFCMPPGLGQEAVLAAMDRKRRNVLRTTQAQTSVEWHYDVERFVATSHRQFAAQRRPDLHRYDEIGRIFTASQQRGRAVILSICTEAGRDAVVTILLWDDARLYFWNTARNPAISGNGTYSCALWESLQLARERGLVFDFDGFASSQAGAFLASFGVPPTVRPVVSRHGALAQMFTALKTGFRAARA